MALLQAGYIDGARVKAELLRREAWISSGGVSGVADALSLKVNPLGTPGAAVVVNAGGGIAETGFSDAPKVQSYVVGNDSAITLPVPSTAGTWQVVISIRDPQYAGQTVPSDPLNDKYCDLELLPALPTGKPYLWLATITKPATSAVDASMITDRRVLARPRQFQEVPRIVNASGSNDMWYNPYGNWPLTNEAYKQTYNVPTWATHAVITLLINGIYVPTAGAAPVYGGIRLMFPQLGVSTDHAIVYSDSLNNRVGIARGYSVAIPESRRGQTLDIHLQGQNTKGNPTQLRADYQTQFTWSLMWLERL